MATGQDINPIRPFRISTFSGGINTSAPATEIADNEAVEIVNMEFDDGDNLVVRNGVFASAGIAGLWDSGLWDINTWDTNSALTYNKRITSILDFENESGFVGILYTTGTKLFSRTLGGTITDLTGLLVLPDDVRWYWKILNGVAIGVNGLPSGDNPIKVTGTAPGTAALLTGAPKGNFIEVWNSRVWIAKADFPNQLQASNIGDPLTWDTDAGANPSHGAIFDIDKNDGDEITGLYATKERLFVFKRRSIHILFAKDQSVPATNLGNIKVDKYANNIGCIAATTIRATFDDVLFLSYGGIASLSAAQVVADFKSAIISTKVRDIANIPKSIPAEDVFAFTVGDMNQYWLSVSHNASITGKNLAYVLDYRLLPQGIIRWFIVDGLVAGTAMEVLDHDVNQLIYLIGCHADGTTNFFIGTYTPKAEVRIFNDNGLAYRKEIRTKAYDFDMPDIRKLFLEWFLGLKLNTINADLSVSYFLDQSLSNSGNYTFSFTGVFGGTFWDVGFFDVDLYDNLTQGLNQNLIRKGILLNENGRKGVSLQFDILNNTKDQGYEINNFGIKYIELSERKTATA